MFDQGAIGWHKPIKIWPNRFWVISSPKATPSCRRRNIIISDQPPDKKPAVFLLELSLPRQQWPAEEAQTK